MYIDQDRWPLQESSKYYFLTGIAHVRHVNKIPPRNYRRREKARGKTRRNVCGEQQ